MPNNEKQRTISASVPVSKADLYAAYARDNKLTVSKLIIKAIEALIVSLPTPGTRRVPIQPERVDAKLHRIPDTIKFSSEFNPQWAHLGLMAQDDECLYGIWSARPLDPGKHTAAVQQFIYICGYASPLKDPDFLPTHRHPQDEAWLDWWEHDFTEKNQPDMVERVHQIREHIATLPTGPTTPALQSAVIQPTKETA